MNGAKHFNDLSTSKSKSILYATGSQYNRFRAAVIFSTLLVLVRTQAAAFSVHLTPSE